MDVKKARHEKLVMGSLGTSLVGKPSSSTSGGCGGRGTVEGSTSDSGWSSRRPRIGGGAASSESESTGALSVCFSSSTPSLEWARQK
jgi:hypothetical protein